MLEGILKVEGPFLPMFLHIFLILHNGILGLPYDIFQFLLGLLGQIPGN